MAKLLASLCLVHCACAFLQSSIVSTLDGPPPATKECPADLPSTCSLRCANGNYLLDAKGCPTCACASDASIQRVGRPPSNCPLRKCAQGCGARGYQSDADGCRTCECAPAPRTECASAMCRMFCVHGFRRDANGCEICQCNDAPQPCPRVDCQNMCLNGYRKDYGGCPTCSCNVDQSETVIDEGKDCSPMTNCEQKCKYGYERDLAGCQLCSCNRCPLQSCRMFCVFGFKKNKDGCEVCECDWTPVAENIQCSERIPCTGSRVCNLDLKLCETVSADRVNWFVYDFDIDTPLFQDPQFVIMFKNGLINNIASKYRLEPAQVTVSGVEARGQTAFQIMPYFRENMDDFQKKMDDIDADLNSQAFSSVLPAVAKNIDKSSWKSSGSSWYRLVQQRPIVALYVSGILVGIVAALLAVIYAVASRQCNFYPRRSESKSPIFDTPYQPAPTEEEQYHAIHAPDGTAYVVVESEETPAANDKRALV